MPIPYVDTTSTAAAGPVVIPPPPPPAPPSVPSVSWTPAGGKRVFLLPGSGRIDLMHGVDGVDMPPEDQYRTPYPGDGDIYSGRRATGRPMMLPLLVFGPTYIQQQASRRQVMTMFDPRRGPGVLSWDMPDGTRRDISALYTGGLESPLNGHLDKLPLHHMYQVLLHADDPYFLGEEDGFSVGGPEQVDFFPGPPFHISETNTLGLVTVFIHGEVGAYPTWTLSGPMATATLTNLDSGESLVLTPSLQAGSKLIVRTDPRVVASEKFTSSTGANRWATTAGQFPSLWPLLPGENNLSITATGTAPTSQVECEYRPRYLTV